jgi:uncharacterized protein YkwD
MACTGPSARLSRRALFGAGALLMAGGVWPARAAPGAPAPWLAYEQRLSDRLADAGGGTFDTSFAAALLAETNRFRAAQRLPQLAWSDGLAASASAHAADMAARRYFAHQSPEGFGHAERVSLLSRDECAQTGENLAWRDDPRRGADASQIQKMWEDSPGHRRNLTNGDFVQAGYGAVRIGSALYAAGVYGDGAVRLGRALPLNVRAETEIAAAVQGASPAVERIAVTAPGEIPTSMFSADTPLPTLGPGLWQLRPLRAAGPNFAVLAGPVFHIA